MSAEPRKPKRMVSGSMTYASLLQRAFLIGSVCAALGVSAPAAAADASDKAAAEALFQQAKTLMDQKQYAEACEKFRVSQELDAGLGTLLHLADCYEKMGRTASAWATFEEAASVAASRGDTNRHDIARGRAMAVKPRLSYVVVRSAELMPTGTTVMRDGRAIPSAVWGVPVPVDPGTTTITVSAPGYQVAKLEVAVPAQAPAPVEVVLPPLVKDTTSEPVAATPPAPAPAAIAEPPQPSPLPPPPPETSAQETWGLVLGGVGIVALGVSAVFTLTGYSDYKDSLDDCSSTNENACGVAGTAKRNDAVSDLNVATVVGSAGAVVLGTGVVLYVTAPSASPGSSVTQALSTRGIGLGYQGAW